MSREATERMFQFAREQTPPPIKITEHKQRIEQATAQLERQVMQTGRMDLEATQNIVKMKLALDGLYADWAEGVERIRWIEVPTKAEITVEQILRECVYTTESMTGDMGVEALAVFLDANGCGGILKELAERCLAEVRQLLEEGLILDEDVLKVLRDPKSFFNITDEEEVRRRVAEHFTSRVNKDSPQHVIRAMIAYIEFGVGEYAESIHQAGFAHNEKDVENFEEKFYRPKDPDVEAAMLKVETRKAEILIELLAQRRSS